MLLVLTAAVVCLCLVFGVFVATAVAVLPLVPGLCRKQRAQRRRKAPSDLYGWGRGAAADLVGLSARGCDLAPVYALAPEPKLLQTKTRVCCCCCQAI